MPARAAILEQWLARALEVYGVRVAQLAVAEHDGFRNPVGRGLRTHLSVLVAQLLGSMDSCAIGAALENIMAVRAVQDLSVEDALGFIFALREIIRQQAPAADRAETERRIDTLALEAFSQYVRHRENLSALRLNEQVRALGPLPYRLRGARQALPGQPRATDP